MKNQPIFDEWWESIEEGLVQTIARIAAEDAEDIAQDVSLMAVTRFDEFESREAFRRWCLKRANWLAINAVATRRRFTRRSNQIIEEMATRDDDDLDLLGELIERLPETQKKVTLARIVGFTSDEIAEQYGMTESSVRSNWRHAKNNLVSYFEEDK
jgi:RNA polymerase sigma factor (sigma-70 family)